MKKLLVVSLTLLSFLFVNAEELTLDKVKEVASKATSELNSKLKKELKKAKKADKTKGMTSFCIDESPKIIDEIDKKYGSKVSIKRVSLNNRSEKSKVLKDEINILKAFDLIQKSDAYQPKQIIQIVDENTYKVYSPVEMKSRDCKKCHGLEKKVDKDSKKRFSDVYKNDNGYGHKSGEIRGAVVITISK
ncbi:DUF3365 domain-containing protein [Arcobacter sp. LA11]|uniref:c-type heme family protein n=1 Tax=Arcobacter sp. LA11 TaxID=1898176 RepID=UPI0009352C18|nr:DUF3365 domain-containing protein [Arcobacter sp. LA11]